MSQKISKPLDAVLFFDECVSCLEECTNGCERNENILCKHRFRFSSYAVCGRKVSGGLSDFRVILKFMHLVRGRKLPVTISPSTKLILVTRDKRFLTSASRQSKTKKGSLLDFDHKKRMVSWGDTTVSLLFVRCKNPAGSVHVDLRCIIRELNELFE
ncbi:MAG: hypothetical protein WD898_03000 [Candidatus Paceibacterota bacterium]